MCKINASKGERASHRRFLLHMFLQSGCRDWWLRLLPLCRRFHRWCAGCFVPWLLCRRVSYWSATAIGIWTSLVCLNKLLPIALKPFIAFIRGQNTSSQFRFGIGMQAYPPQCSLIVAMPYNGRDDFYNRPLFGMLANGGMQTYIIQHYSNIILL